jgi:hypothetical protein
MHYESAEILYARRGGNDTIEPDLAAGKMAIMIVTSFLF